MLKWEICSNPVTLNEMVSETGVLNKICRLYTISEDKANQKDWISWFFTSPFRKLTHEEVYQAHVMALNSDLLNEAGERFKIFPVLSMIQSAAILRAYVLEKGNNEKVWKARKELEKLMLPEKTKGEIKKEEEETLYNYAKIIFKELQDKGFTEKATFYFPYIKSKIKITKEAAQRLYRYQAYLFLKKFTTIKDIKDLKMFDMHVLIASKSIEELKENLISGSPIEPVKQQCRDIVVSKYLKKFKTIEDLLGELKNLKNEKNK